MIRRSSLTALISPSAKRTSTVLRCFWSVILMLDALRGICQTPSIQPGGCSNLSSSVWDCINVSHHQLTYFRMGIWDPHWIWSCFLVLRCWEVLAPTHRLVHRVICLCSASCSFHHGFQTNPHGLAGRFGVLREPILPRSSRPSRKLTGIQFIQLLISTPLAPNGKMYFLRLLRSAFLRR